MGLDCTHGAFHGAYSAFSRLRKEVAWAAGGIYPRFDFDDPEEAGRLKELGVYEKEKEARYSFGDGIGIWYVPDEVTREAWPGLYVFLEHSDCDGEISPEDCVRVADDLEKLLPKVRDREDGGHIGRDGGYRAVLKKFIDGCRLAASRNEPLGFH